MVVTVFHLVAIGVLALLSVVGTAWPGSSEALVGRLGVFLLLLAVAHGLTLAVLARRRQGELVESRFQQQESAAAPHRRLTSEPSYETTTDASSRPSTVIPVPGQVDPHPMLTERDARAVVRGRGGQGYGAELDYATAGP
ncbi:hypothetical protein [Amycolatopsis sp. NPDC051372]|uniref:hypothetical protein n=1 Tax=unclassified Amycolatopsis TaxID=2618356 RepID=UPI0034282AF1